MTKLSGLLIFNVSSKLVSGRGRLDVKERVMRIKKHLSDQQRKALIKRLVASAEPKKRSLRPPSDHWQQTPRENGRFSSDRPTSKKVVNFKIPVDLMEELEQLAIARNTSIHLVCKDFIIRNFDEMVRQCQEESQE